MTDPYKEYKKTQIKTANQGKLIIMLYDGAIKAINTALDNIEMKSKYDIVNSNIIKAQDIITELLVSLNFDAGEIAKNLFSLYSYMNKRLIEGNIQKKSEPLNEVKRMLNELKDVWLQISSKSLEGHDDGKTGLNISG